MQQGQPRDSAAMLHEPSASLALVRAALDGLIERLRGWDIDQLLPQPHPGEIAHDLLSELATRLTAGGKQLRPTFAIWGWVAAGGQRAPETHAQLIDVGAALELLHLFALVQDDVMDRSDHRRGMPTLHVTAAERHRATNALGDPVLFGDSVATLLGDLALAEASLLVAPAPTPVRELWRLMTVELVHGQLWDITQTASRERRLEVSAAIARLKTGRYTVARPLQLGALTAGASDDLVAGLGRWGDLVGDAFAIRDDVLGVWGDPATTGKPAGDDLRWAKPTVLLACAADRAPESGRDLMARCNAGRLDDAAVADLSDRLVDWGVRDLAETMIQDAVSAADALLDTLTVEPTAASALRALAATAAWRSS